jgi:MFS family permease
LRIGLQRIFTALRHRNYRLYWFGQIVSLIGTWMQSVGQGWLVYQLTNSPFALGLVGFSSSLPILVFSLWGGVVTDRMNKRTLITITQTASMFQAFALWLLYVSGRIQVWHVIAAAFLLGLINAFDAPARQAFVIEMVSKEDLMNAIALSASAFNSARILGPAIAGVLVSVPAVGIGGLFFLNGVSFLAVIAALLMMRLPPSLALARHGSVWANLIEGLRYIWHNPVVLTLESLVAVASIFGMPYAALMPVFARDILRVGAEGYGLLLALTGVGALVGSLGLASLGNFRHKGWLLTAGNLLFPATLLALAFSRSYTLSMVIMVGVGWAMVTQNATANTLLQTMVPDRLRGRVMSVHALMFLGMTPFGNLQAGMVANFLGAPFAVSLGAVLAGLCGLFVFWRLPQVRRLE